MVSSAYAATAAAGATKLVLVMLVLSNFLFLSSINCEVESNSEQLTESSSKFSLPLKKQQIREKAKELSTKDVERLSKMFRQSSEVATNGLLELNLLRHLNRHLHTAQLNGAPASANSLDQVESDPNKVTLHVDTKDQKHDRQFSINTDKIEEADDVDKKENFAASEENKKMKKLKTSSLKKLDNRAEDSILKILHIMDPTAHSEARQSNLFSGFHLPTTPALPAAMTSNPLMSGFLRPPSLPTFPMAQPATPPSFPTFQLPTLPPATPRPPKTSVIGGGTGPMALTNDNVVVVNVLSGNYK